MGKVHSLSHLISIKYESFSAGLTSVNIQQITHKFREILRMKSTEQPTVLNSLDVRNWNIVSLY